MGKGSSKGHTPREAKDNLKSSQMLSVIDAISEGPIEGPVDGLKSVLLNSTPVLDSELLTAQLRLGPADILESDENGIIPEQARVITQVVILDADKKQIQCVVRPLQILRADGTWENIGGMK